jgi:hypothetical protein
MKTVLICGDEPAPAALRELIAKGSTSLEERRPADAAAAAGAADRIVFWRAAGDSSLDTLAAQLARQEAAERREVIVFVSADAAAPGIEGLSPNEQYVWPRDRDRLEITFLTGG